MSWNVVDRTVAETTGATFKGSVTADGAAITLDVAFGIKEWPWEEKGPVS